MLKKIGLVLALLAATVAPARAGIYYDLQQTVSSATWKLSGVSKWYAGLFSGAPTVTVDGVTGGVSASSFTATATGNSQFAIYTSTGIQVNGGGGIYAAFFKATTAFIGNLIGNVTGNLTGNVTGNLTGVASQATIFDHTPTKCSAGNYNLGVDNGGNAQNCTPAGVGDVTQAASNSFNTAGTNQTFGSSVTFNGGIYGNASFSSSSWTYIPSQSFAASLTVPHFVSSATLTTDGVHPLKACFYGTAQTNSASASALGWAVWIDNVKYAPGMPAGTMGATALFQKCMGGNTGTVNCSSCQPIFGTDIPGSGSHTFAIYFWDPQNFAFSIPANYIVTDKALWGVEQIR